MRTTTETVRLPIDRRVLAWGLGTVAGTIALGVIVAMAVGVSLPESVVLFDAVFR